MGNPDFLKSSEAYSCSHGEADHGLLMSSAFDTLEEFAYITISAAAEAVEVASVRSWIYVEAEEVVGVERARRRPRRTRIVALADCRW